MARKFGLVLFILICAREVWPQRICESRGNDNSPLKSAKYYDYYANSTWFCKPGNQISNLKTTEEPSELYFLDKNFPFYPLEKAQNITIHCRRAVNKLMKNALIKHELNALKVLDSTAKPSSGILRGNVNQYGDFDECLEAENSKYCLAEIDIEPIWSRPWDKYKNLVHSHFIIRETFVDPKHRIPGFSNLRWGFCIPKQCSHKDLETSLQEIWKVRARINPSMCQVSDSPKIQNDFAYKVTRILILLIAFCVALSTYIYNKNELITGNKFYNMLMSFCLQKNWKQITTMGQNRNEIKAVHGVRFLAALGLIMSHKVMSLFYNPYINRTEMTEGLSMKWSVIGRTAIVFTDAFMVLSGLLTANALFADLDKYGKMNFGQKFVSRIFRILPNLIAVILFCTYILPTMGSGPLWPTVVNHHSELCKQNMWKNMLFIHNYFGFENMCLTHTHQVGIDMQLFMITPLFVYLIWKNKKIGILVMAITAVISTILRFWATMKYNLSHVIYCGMPISQIFQTANFSYILPTHRITIYLMGVYLAYILKYSKRGVNFSKTQLVLIWSFIYMEIFTAWLGPVHMSIKEYRYNKWHAAIYGAFSPILIGSGVCLVIYFTNKGLGNFLGWVLTWKYFEIFSKISYAVYLTQFPIFFYNIGITKHVGEYKSYMMLQILETGIIIGISMLLTLTIELPFQNIRKVLFGNASSFRGAKDKLIVNGEEKVKK